MPYVNWRAKCDRRHLNFRPGLGAFCFEKAADFRIFILVLDLPTAP